MLTFIFVMIVSQPKLWLEPVRITDSLSLLPLIKLLKVTTIHYVPVIPWWINR